MPATQQLQQCVLVDREFLQRLALNTWNNASDKPARLAHLDHRDQRRIHIKRVETSAEIVHSLGFAFRHGEAPSRCGPCSDRYVSPLPPHSILTGPSTAACSIGWAGGCRNLHRHGAHVDHTRPPPRRQIQQHHTSARNTPAESACKIIGKFKPLILGEVHAAGNTGVQPRFRQQKILRLKS
jgi:hypothetical protein